MFCKVKIAKLQPKLLFEECLLDLPYFYNIECAKKQAKRDGNSLSVKIQKYNNYI